MVRNIGIAIPAGIAAFAGTSEFTWIYSRICSPSTSKRAKQALSGEVVGNFVLYVASSDLHVPSSSPGSGRKILRTQLNKRKWSSWNQATEFARLG